VDLRVDDGLAELSPAVACTIYRAVQEGMANACKHARPGLICVQIGLSPSHVTATVLNDDCPADTSGAAARDAAPQGSYGLVGLRERADAVGGGLEAGPLPEGGFRLRLVLPVEAES
jgi:signal transduction histidine kinase